MYSDVSRIVSTGTSVVPSFLRAVSTDVCSVLIEIVSLVPSFLLLQLIQICDLM